MQTASLPTADVASQWSDVIARLPPGLDLEQSSRDSGDLRRRRKVGDAGTLLRLALAHGPGALSLRSAAAWAGLTGVAQLSDVALRRRLRGAADWLGQIAGALLSQRSSTAEGLLATRLRIVDGMSTSKAGDDGTTWRIHASFDPAAACFTDLQVTSADVGEGFSRFSFKPGDLAMGDRFYAKPPGLQHVLRSGADFLVRVGSVPNAADVLASRCSSASGRLGRVSAPLASGARVQAVKRRTWDRPAAGTRPGHGTKLAALTPDPGFAHRGRRKRSPRLSPLCVMLVMPTPFPCGACKQSSGLRCSAPS